MSADSTATLTVTINGEAQCVPAPMTVAELLRHLQVEPRQVAVERNKELVPKARWELVVLTPGDALEIVTFIGGG